MLPTAPRYRAFCEEWLRSSCDAPSSTRMWGVSRARASAYGMVGKARPGVGISGGRRPAGSRVAYLG